MNYVYLPASKDKDAMIVLNKWYFKKGDRIKAGDALASYEDEKSAIDIISEFTGAITEIYAAEGEAVPAGGRICSIE